MFTHHKLKVYRKALECPGSAERLLSGWARKNSFVDHFCRASESIVLNIAEGARLRSGPAEVMTLDHAIGSALDRAACLDLIFASKRVRPLVCICLPERDSWDESRRC